MTTRVLIAEDSITVRELLVAVLGADPQLAIVGTANDGIQACEMTHRLRPDVITMDVHMPKMNGFEATRRIMAEVPTPIVIVSGSSDARGVEFSLNALRAGAVALAPRPSSPTAPGFAAEAAELRRTVRAMAQVKVIRHWGTTPRVPLPVSRNGAASRIVAVAASTGGPAALERLFSALPAHFPAPILVVQHIALGFTEGLCAWLDASSPLSVRVPHDGDPLEPGTIYLAPEDRHLTVGRGGRARLLDDAPRAGFRPSATVLFESVSEHFGAAAVAVVLTGMGSDGAGALAAVHSSGGKVIAQDEATSVVFGMPSAAVATGATDFVLPLHQIPAKLIRLCQTKEQHGEQNSGR